jgi:polyadenylate-binding protein
MDTQQYIYLYDLPKKEVSSIKIAQAFKDKAGVTLADSQKPQIKKDLTKPFYTAMVNIKDPDQFKQACEKMRYFDIEGKPCRALPFDRQLLGSNKEKLISQNIFVRAPKHMLHEDLHKTFEQFGPIKSLKASLNPDYSSRGYGFICFENPESAQRAIEAKDDLNGTEVIRFEPKDNKANMRKLMNNVYVKNIPIDWTPENVRAMFEAHGNIKSLVLKKNDIGQFGFVCYDDPGNRDKEYGPKCAAEAIDKLNNTSIAGEGEKAPRLVVRHALKGTERAAEKIRETIRYKTSKKRCNLYVKNFPNTYKKEDLMKLFSQFGEIENIRLDKGQTGNAFAFVCFKEPTDAAKAKTNLHNYAVDGKQLVICYYEIKELRQLQNEEAKDKADWEKYQAQQTGGFQWNELTQLPNLTQILTTLMQVIHMHEAKNAQTNQAERMYTNQRHGG